VLLFCPCEHVEGVVDSPERAEQPRLGDHGGRGRRSGSQLFENSAGLAGPARRRERPPQDADKEGQPQAFAADAVDRPFS